MRENPNPAAVDVRVVSLYSQDTDIVPLQVTTPSQHKMLEYFNVMDILPPSGGGSPLLSAYQTSRSRGTEHNSSQILLTFTDISEEPGGNGYTREEIDAFWKDTSEPLLFVTLLNVEDTECLAPVVERIRDKYSGHKHLIYFTLDYCEAVVFLKCGSFRRCAELVFSLDYGPKGAPSDAAAPARETEEDKRPALLANSLTLYSLVTGFNLTDPAFQPDESFGVYLRIGMSDARRAKDFCNELKAKSLAECQIDPSNNWILGRYDVGIYLPKANLRWIGLASSLLSQSNLPRSPEDPNQSPWCTSHTFSILIEPSAEDLPGRISSHNSNNTALGERMKREYGRFHKAYRQACRKLKIPPDEVFLRWADSASAQAVSFCGSNVMSDLGICLVAQFLDFFAYGQRLWSAKSISNTQRKWAEKCFSTFFSSILILVDGMNHSARQFILTPPFRTIVFEMPPKVMAYYTALTHRLIDVFNDNHPEERYGVVISPQFARELNVQSLAHENGSDGNEFIAIGIGEEWLYRLQHTTAVLAHEISHFVGKSGRERAFRKRCILLAEMQHILQELSVKLQIALVEYCGGVAERLGAKLPEGERLPQKGAVYIDMSQLEREAEKLLDILCGCDGRYASESEHVYKRDVLVLLRKAPFFLRDNRFLQNEVFAFLWRAIIADEDGITNIGRCLAWTEYFYSGTAPERGTSPAGGEASQDENPPAGVNLLAILDGLAKHRVRAMLQDLLKQYADQFAFVPQGQPAWAWQTSDLFSEAYADLQAVLLLDLSWDEYCGLFGHLKESLPDTVQPRLLAMRTVLFTDAPPREPGREQEEFSSLVRKIETLADMLGGFSRESADIADISEWYRILGDAGIDPSAFRYLEGYLSRCRRSIEAHFKTRAAETRALRNIYRDVSDRGGVYRLFDSMMKFIAAYRKELQDGAPDPE